MTRRLNRIRGKRMEGGAVLHRVVSEVLPEEVAVMHKI